MGDEVHEFKARGSAQGLAAAALAGSSKKVLALTGTLFGGYSTTLFHLLYRFTPEVKKEFRHNEESRWASRYGILERITKFEEGHSEDGAVSRRRRYHTRVVERPGISPEVIFHLIDKGVFLRLSDLSVRLPPYREEVLLSEMEPAQKEAYRKLASDLIRALKEQLAKGNKSLLAVYLQALLSYPDQPFREEIIVDRETGEIVARAPALPEEKVYPKEQRLIDLVKEEISQGRKVLLYVTHTERRDITGRLEKLLKAEGISVAVLKSHTVSPERREGWIAEKLREGIRVLVTQPRIVQTLCVTAHKVCYVFFGVMCCRTSEPSASRIFSFRTPHKSPLARGAPNGFLRNSSPPYDSKSSSRSERGCIKESEGVRSFHRSR